MDLYSLLLLFRFLSLLDLLFIISLFFYFLLLVLPSLLFLCSLHSVSFLFFSSVHSSLIFSFILLFILFLIFHFLLLLPAFLHFSPPLLFIICPLSPSRSIHSILLIFCFVLLHTTTLPFSPFFVSSPTDRCGTSANTPASYMGGSSVFSARNSIRVFTALSASTQMPGLYPR